MSLDLSCAVHANIDQDCPRCMWQVQMNAPAIQYGLSRAERKGGPKDKRGIRPCKLHVQHSDCTDCRKWRGFAQWCFQQYEQRNVRKDAYAENSRFDKQRRVERLVALIKAEGEGRSVLRTDNVYALKVGAAGFIYLVTNPAHPGWVKAGSTVDLDQRMAVYQTGDPHRSYRLAASAPTLDRVLSEVKLLRRLGRRAAQTQGEWFQIDEAVAERSLRKSATIHDVFVDTVSEGAYTEDVTSP